VGLTDTDDAWGVIDKGRPVKIVYPDSRPNEIGALVIPNTASMIAGARRPEGARKFLDYLLSDRAESLLAAPPARHLPTRQTVKAAKDATPLYLIKPMKVDWKKVAAEVELQVKELKAIFPR
jgi:iron(III) transport system substrate-binding protein